MNMHWGLRAAVGAAIVLFVVHAGFTQFYETGYSQIIAPLASLTFAGLFFAFLTTRQWSWTPVFWVAVADIIINLAFLPERQSFGDYVFFAQVLVAAEVVVCAIVLGYMVHPTTKQRFHRAHAS